LEQEEKTNTEERTAGYVRIEEKKEEARNRWRLGGGGGVKKKIRGHAN
jgi:hypothetical protein